MGNDGAGGSEEDIKVRYLALILYTSIIAGSLPGIHAKTTAASGLDEVLY